MLLMCIKAFIVGGLICVIGQLLIDITKMTPARILVSFVCAGVLLGALGLYPKLVDFAGAGATLPLPGFGNALTAILDSNITTVIAAAVLYYFGSGPLRGFAMTLTLGIIASLFNFEKKGYFKAAEGAETAPKVEF